MTCKNIAVICENERGEVYQVALTENEIKAVQNLIIQLHDGVMRILTTQFHGIILTNTENEINNE